MQNFKCKSFFPPHVRKINPDLKTLMYTLNISMIFLEFTYTTMRNILLCGRSVRLYLYFHIDKSGVERGFSVNKKFLVENLGELSLVSQCIVYDYITSLGVPVHEYYIPNDLVKSCKGANARYVAAMESKKVECEKTKKERKRKLSFDWNAEVKRSRESIESCIATVNKDINKHSFEAEEKSHLTLLTKANVL